MTPERLRERRRMREQREMNGRLRDEFAEINADFWARHETQQAQIRAGLEDTLNSINKPWHDLLATLKTTT